MVASMTAFARSQAAGPWGRATWELRSVNHRYLEIVVRLPEDLRALEPEVRRRVAAAVRRGKVECSLRLQPDAAAPAALELDGGTLAALAAALDEVSERLSSVAPPGALDLLRWPGVVRSPVADPDHAGPALMDALERALGELVATRRREGAALARAVGERIERITALEQQLRRRLPELEAEWHQRLRTRVAELEASVDPQRLEQELALLVARADIAEELDRLRAHCSEVRRVIAGDQPMGRRLDFLMQEMNREANTIASKSSHQETSFVALELKVLIEQAREQVQNIE